MTISRISWLQRALRALGMLGTFGGYFIQDLVYSKRPMRAMILQISSLEFSEEGYSLLRVGERGRRR